MGDVLEARLEELAAAIDFPATPPLARAVAERLARPRGTSAWLPGRRVGRGAAIALAATLLLAGIAAAVGIALGGLRLVFGPTGFSPQPTMAVGPGLGHVTTLGEARGQIGFVLRVPGLTELGEPDQVYLAEPPVGGVVTLLYGERSGYPVDAGTGFGLIVTQFRADIGPEVFEKLIDNGVRVTAARVNGQPAWWVAGGEHYFFYRDADGRMVDSTVRLAGDTLIWEELGVTHRVEGAPSVDAAIAVAESLE